MARPLSIINQELSLHRTRLVRQFKQENPNAYRKSIKYDVMLTAHIDRDPAYAELFQEASVAKAAIDAKLELHEFQEDMFFTI